MTNNFEISIKYIHYIMYSIYSIYIKLGLVNPNKIEESIFGLRIFRICVLKML